MAKFKKFEDIDTWQKARILAKQIHEITQAPIFKENQELKCQIKKSAGSIMDNIAEGFEREGKKEFIQFLSVSKGSAGEIRSKIYRSFDSGLISRKQGEELLKLAEEISMMLEGLMHYLRKSELKGTKYKNPSYLPKGEEQTTLNKLRYKSTLNIKPETLNFNNLKN